MSAKDTAKCLLIFEGPAPAGTAFPYLEGPRISTSQPHSGGTGQPPGRDALGLGAANTSLQDRLSGFRSWALSKPLTSPYGRGRCAGTRQGHSCVRWNCPRTLSSWGRSTRLTHDGWFPGCIRALGRRSCGTLPPEDGGSSVCPREPAGTCLQTCIFLPGFLAPSCSPQTLRTAWRHSPNQTDLWASRCASRSSSGMGEPGLRVSPPRPTLPSPPIMIQTVGLSISRSKTASLTLCSFKWLLGPLQSSEFVPFCVQDSE